MLRQYLRVSLVIVGFRALPGCGGEDFAAADGGGTGATGSRSAGAGGVEEGAGGRTATSGGVVGDSVSGAAGVAGSPVVRGGGSAGISSGGDSHGDAGTGGAREDGETDGVGGAAVGGNSSIAGNAGVADSGVSAGSSSGGSSLAETGGGADRPACEAGATRPCADGGFHGPCAAGFQRCTEAGDWGGCSIAPAVADLCVTGDDSDCDGTANEDCLCIAGTLRACEDSRGNCAGGFEVCSGGGQSWSECSIAPEENDVCAPGDDADCDGIPNEGCECDDGATQPCGPETESGNCARGVSTCVDGAWGPCEGAVYPVPRDCTSSADNDCDGLPDDTEDEICACFPGETSPCGEHPEDGIGTCRAGTRTCVVGPDGSSSAWSETCDGSVGPGPEICDQTRLDENCDGVVNEAPTCPWYQQLASGFSSSCGLLASGEVRCWGSNDYWELGDETLTESPSPIVVPNLSAQSIAGGLGFHYCALTSEGGSVRCWGRGAYGQLGNGATANSALPVVTTPELTGTGIGVGAHQSCVVGTSPTSARPISCWGRNAEGQLGAAAGSSGSTVPVEVPGTDGAQSFQGGNTHSCILASDSSIQCWGDNTYGQLGDGSVSGAVGMAVGASEVCALLANRTLTCWGHNLDGRLGRGNFDATDSLPGPVEGLGNVERVAAGSGHICAVVENGSVYCWGKNLDGQLGNGDASGAAVAEPVLVVGIDSAVGISCGRDHSCAVLRDGSVRCWGLNDRGQLGVGTNLLRSAVPLEVAGMYD